MEVKDAKRVQRPKLPKKRLLRKTRKQKSDPERLHGKMNAAKSEHKTRKAVKFCPKCGSTDIFFASGLPQLRSLWDCRNCGYRGGLILEDGRLALKLAEEYAKRVSER